MERPLKDSCFEKMRALLVVLRRLHSDETHRYFTFCSDEHRFTSDEAGTKCIVRGTMVMQSYNAVRAVEEELHALTSCSAISGCDAEKLTTFVQVVLANFTALIDGGGHDGEELRWDAPPGCAKVIQERDSFAIADKAVVVEIVDNLLRGVRFLETTVLAPTPVVPSPPPETLEDVSARL